MENSISVDQFIKAIKRLPEDDQQVVHGVWYKTQKEHWLGWLREYDGPGAYGRIPGKNRDARYAYNHVVCPEMLMYLIRVIPLRPDLVTAAEKAYAAGSTMMEKSGAIRKVVPWEEVDRVI